MNQNNNFNNNKNPKIIPKMTENSNEISYPNNKMDNLNQSYNNLFDKPIMPGSLEKPLNVKTEYPQKNIQNNENKNYQSFTNAKSGGFNAINNMNEKVETDNIPEIGRAHV